MKRAMWIPSLASLWLAVSAAAAPAAPCGGFDAVARRLEADYGELRQAYGIASDGRLMIFWASRATGSWTITVSEPNGRTCLLASGDGFVAVPTPAEDGDPA